jgi:hypothetical protein
VSGRPLSALRHFPWYESPRPFPWVLDANSPPVQDGHPPLRSHLGRWSRPGMASSSRATRGGASFHTGVCCTLPIPPIRLPVAPWRDISAFLPSRMLLASQGFTKNGGSRCSGCRSLLPDCSPKHYSPTLRAKRRHQPLQGLSPNRPLSAAASFLRTFKRQRIIGACCGSVDLGGDREVSRRRPRSALRCRLSLEPVTTSSSGIAQSIVRRAEGSLNHLAP